MENPNTKRMVELDEVEKLLQDIKSFIKGSELKKYTYETEDLTISKVRYYTGEDKQSGYYIDYIIENKVENWEISPDLYNLVIDTLGINYTSEEKTKLSKEVYCLAEEKVKDQEKIAEIKYITGFFLVVLFIIYIIYG